MAPPLASATEAKRAAEGSNACFMVILPKKENTNHPLAALSNTFSSLPRLRQHWGNEKSRQLFATPQIRASGMIMGRYFDLPGFPCPFGGDFPLTPTTKVSLLCTSTLVRPAAWIISSM